jgi:fatty acid/phospholipid biosynthesis enzyme
LSGLCDGEDDMTQRLRTGRGQHPTGEAAERPQRERWVSMLEGIRPYQRGWLQADIIAGITLAAVPDGAATLVVGRGGGIEPGLVACLPNADTTRCMPMDMPAICQSVRYGTPRSTSQLPMRSRL